LRSSLSNTHFLCLVVEKFRQTTGFNGKVSIIGHSLGSVISWDILSHQYAGNDSSDTPPDGASVYSNHSLSERSGTPELTSQDMLGLPPLRSYPRLDFKVQNFFLLGSPVPVFLMIRNPRKPLSEDFTLPGCSRVFAIHHPYDPVAYRLEPCIDPRNADFEPALIKHWNGGLRVQYRTKRLWRKLMETTSTTQRQVAEVLEQGMAGMGLIDSNSGDDESVSESSTVTVNCVITGSLNEGRRIDYSLQEKEIESANEYVSALAAHSSYWIEKDLSLFIARQIYLSTVEDTSAAFEMEAMTPVAMTMYPKKNRSSDVSQSET
jgi:DDHD domain